MKVKKAKAKVAAKVAKGKAKLRRKLGKVKAVLVLFALAAVASGCASTGSQPSRTQSQNNEFKDCTFILAAKATVSNQTIQAEGDATLPCIELFTQTQGNDGSETVSPTATPTNTTDIRPDVDVNTTGGRSAGVLETLIGAFGTWLTTPSGKDAVSATAPANSTGGDCKDGNCSPCTDGSCSDGSCSECTLRSSR